MCDKTIFFLIVINTHPDSSDWLHVRGSHITSTAEGTLQPFVTVASEYPQRYCSTSHSSTAQKETCVASQRNLEVFLVSLHQETSSE